MSAPTIFSKPMQQASHCRQSWSLTVGPFRCIIYGIPDDFSWILSDQHDNPQDSGDSPTPELASAAIERALTDIETAIRQARCAND